MRRPWRIAAFTLFSLTVLAGALFGDRLLALSESARDGLRQYTELVEAVHSHYGTDVTYKDVVYSSINGMLRKLDPHTSFLPPEAYAKMRDRQQSSFYGLGILVGMRDTKLTVISPLEGTPASRMGIRAGDIITAIEGEPTDGMALDDAVMKLKGPKDTEVTITRTLAHVQQYLRHVARLTIAAADVEAGGFDPASLDDVVQHGSDLGRLARVFQSMVREVQARVQRLQQQVQELRIEIDQSRKARQVAEVTETDYFRRLQQEAQTLRTRTTRHGDRRPTQGGQDAPEEHDHAQARGQSGAAAHTGQQ